MGSFVTCTFAKYNENYQVKEGEIGWACCRHKRRKLYRILVGKKKKKAIKKT
jgi:hypothetical protein